MGSPAAHPRNTGRAGVSQQSHVLRSGPALVGPAFLLPPCSEQRSASHCQKLETLPKAYRAFLNILCNVRKDSDTFFRNCQAACSPRKGTTGACGIGGERCRQHCPLPAAPRDEAGLPSQALCASGQRAAPSGSAEGQQPHVKDAVCHQGGATGLPRALAPLGPLTVARLQRERPAAFSGSGSRFAGAAPKPQPPAS